MTSQRHKKKSISEGVAKLRKKSGWDPQAPTSPSIDEQLDNLGQSKRTEKTYTEGEACLDCSAAREKSSDDTALCPAHFSELMGF